LEVKFRNLVQLREGKRLDVYTDSTGHLTVGIGHAVQTWDKLALGQLISEAQCSDFFHSDGAKALAAAKVQGQVLGIEDENFLAVLASVNFQLGIMWYTKLFGTWKDLQAGRYIDAAIGLGGTLWHSQTPVRVGDFQLALALLGPKAPGGSAP
jgi:GH24 family phage-related lysozyme (muramidase)